MRDMMSMLERMNHGIIALLSAMGQENRHLLGGNCREYKRLKILKKDDFCLRSKMLVVCSQKKKMYKINVCV